MTVANLLSIAGSDPSGGAGIQADLKVFSALGTYGMAVIAGLTAQNTRGVRAVELPSPAFVGAQLTAVLDDIRVDAIKIGMLGGAEGVAVVADILAARYRGPVVVDPVMVASGGGRLLPAEAVAALTALLLPLADVLTPNLPEAHALTGLRVETRGDMPAAARALLDLGPRAVLLKGGHLGGETSPDLLLTGDQQVWLPGPRLRTSRTHGTGCTLSSAVAAQLALGLDTVPACRAAKRYTAGAIAGARALSVGGGAGPTHPLYTVWT